MTTRILIRNTQPSTKIGDAVVKPLTVKETGGGPPRQMVLQPGGEAEFTVDEGRKVTVQEGESDED